MPTRVQFLNLALGSAKQADILTKSATFIKVPKLNMDVPFLNYMTETDKDWIGKGDEFISPAGVYKTNVDSTGRLQRYGSAEFVCWAWAYALGNVALASGLYTIKPILPTVGLELPYWTLAAQIPDVGGNAIDEAHIGCAIESVETNFSYGPDLKTVECNVDYVGSGIHLTPSAVTFPTTLVEKYMRSSSMSIMVNGTDYVAGVPGAKTILKGSMGWKNNLILPLRYTPGSGLDADGFAIGNRILIGNRVPTFNFTAFLTKDSTEYTKLASQLTGTAVVTLTFDATHFVTWTYESVSFERREVTQEEGFVAVSMTVAPKSDPTNGVLVVTSKNGIADIAQ